MKKLTSIITSVVICALSVVPTIASANLLCYNGTNSGPVFYEKYNEIKELIPFDWGDAYRSAELREDGKYSFVVTNHNSTVTGQYCSTMALDTGYYTKIREEEADLLIDYVSEKYPVFTLENITSEDVYIIENGIKVNIYSYRINYNKELSFEDELEVAIDIKENTGLSCSCVFLANLMKAVYLGDINSDNAITASDAAMVLSYYAQGQTGTVPASAEGEVDYSLIADYNNDGAVTAVDAALILSDYAEGQIS